VDLVALRIGAVSRYHWYARFDAVGTHEPGVAVRTDPTLAVPEIVGVGEVVKSTVDTVAVESLVFVVTSYAVFVAVTVTDSVAPASAPTTAYVDAVAPFIGDPFRFHLYDNVAVGDHDPGTAVRVEPTRAVPVIVGVGAVSKTPSPTVLGELAAVVVAYPSRVAVTATETF